VVKKEVDTGIRFFGIPSGYEYMSLLEAIVDASRGQTELSPATKEALKKLTREVIFKFLSPHLSLLSDGCPPGSADGSGITLITASMIEASEFPELSQKYDVMGVPKSIFNETLTLEGAVPEEVYLEQVLKAGGVQVG
jgi:alkyl hydroperoxide reductase subunit AhpF